jgi:acyltransferase-like protein
MLDFDSAIGQQGLVEASVTTQRRYVKGIRVFGADQIPASAFLALSNHPGITDTLSLFMALNRKDLKIIALDRPFLNTLYYLSEHLCYVKDDPNSRVAMIRQVSTHLRNGGAALTFPAGHIEPDPDVYPGAVESLKDWTDSVGAFIRLAPAAAVLPVLVRSVISDRAANHPLLKIKRTKEEREKLAAAFQVLGMVMFDNKPVRVTVQVGKPIYARDLGSIETKIIHGAVLAEMKRLIDGPLEGNGVSIL